MYFSAANLVNHVGDKARRVTPGSHLERNVHLSGHTLPLLFQTRFFLLLPPALGLLQTLRFGKLGSTHLVELREAVE